MNIHGRQIYPDLSRFQKVNSVAQLQEGMVLIDKFACKRTILSITTDRIWLSHKYGIKSKATGRDWPLHTFLQLDNWIFTIRDANI